MRNTDRIVLENVDVAIGQQVILQNLNWTVKQGEHWAITGERASGKTVLSQFLAYKHRLANGRRHYPFLGEQPKWEDIKKAIKLISFTDTSKLFLNAQHYHYYQQRYNSFDSEGHLTVQQYLMDGDLDLEPHMDLLERIGIASLLDVERIKLSSGQTRKLLLAKGLMEQPSVLILDNAYLGLDQGSRDFLNDWLDELVTKVGTTLIIVGHHQDLPKCITHELELTKGRAKTISFSGPTNALQHEEDTPTKSQDQEINEEALSKIKAYCKGKKFPVNKADILYLDDVTISYQDETILNQLNWKVRQGEKWVIYGPNGAGKSTLLSLIYADNPQAYAHRVYLFGKRRGTGESIWDVKRQFGFTSPELHAYFRENPSARNIVMTGLTDTFVLNRKSTEAEKAFAQLLFDYFGLESISGQAFRHLSTGTQRLLLFMRALIKVPPVLLLDEPFQGLDQIDIQRCKILLEQILQKEQTLLFISHYQSEWPTTIEHILEL